MKVECYRLPQSWEFFVLASSEYATGAKIVKGSGYLIQDPLVLSSAGNVGLLERFVAIGLGQLVCKGSNRTTHVPSIGTCLTKEIDRREC